MNNLLSILRRMTSLTRRMRICYSLGVPLSITRYIWLLPPPSLVTYEECPIEPLPTVTWSLPLVRPLSTVLASHSTSTVERPKSSSM